MREPSAISILPVVSSSIPEEAFNWQYNQQDFGAAAAYAVIVMGVSLTATLIYLWVLRTPAAQR